MGDTRRRTTRPSVKGAGLGAALLLITAVLASAPAARAQASGCPDPASPAGGERGAAGPCPCPGDATARDLSAYASGRLDCRPEGNGGVRPSDPLCTSTQRGSSGLLYHASVPFFAPGG